MDISGFGLQINLIASNTFPGGLSLTQFADDADPFDMPSMQIKDSAMGLNGDMITFAKAIPIGITLSVIPNSSDDINLQVLWEANRVGKGKFGAQDVITMTGIYADGSTVTMSGGFISDGMPGTGVASAGRFKSKTYGFKFENIVRS